MLGKKCMCPLCATSFAAYKPEMIEEHYKAHREKERSASICPLCSDDWSALDMAQRKQHLWLDQERTERLVARNFWKGSRCPICGLNLESLKHDDIIDHLLEHPSGLLEYCDRCDAHLSEVLLAEKEHHDEVCDETDNEEDHPSFCARCGKENSHEVDDYGKSHHHCLGTFLCCETCGLNMAKLRNSPEIQLHDRPCVPPGGPRGSFCRMCGDYLLGMTEEDSYAHELECFSSVPTGREQQNTGLAGALLKAALVN